MAGIEETEVMVIPRKSIEWSYANLQEGQNTVGGLDDGFGLPIVNGSKKFGDLRIAHFIGMYALQVLPLLSFYVLKDTKATFY
jgi:hypothetical protein